MASNIKFYDDIHELWENSKIWRDYTSGFGITPSGFFTSIGFTFSGQASAWGIKYILTDRI